MSTDSILINDDLLNGINDIKQSEIDINHLFNQYEQALHNQKWTIADQITEWSQMLIGHIQQHVICQRSILDQEYEKILNSLRIARNKVLEQALVYEKNVDNEKINELLNQCRTIKLTFVQLNKTVRSVPSIEIVAEELMEYQNLNEQSPKMSVNNHKTDEISVTNIEIIDPTSSLTRSESINNQSQLANNDSHTKLNISCYYNLIDTCPICFMIFPKAMNECHRNLHINDHY